MYATEALQGGDASRKDARRRGRRLLGCVHKQSRGSVRQKEIEERVRHTYATETLQGGDASRKDARRVGRRVESWFELSCVE